MARLPLIQNVAVPPGRSAGVRVNPAATPGFQAGRALERVGGQTADAGEFFALREQQARREIDLTEAMGDATRRLGEARDEVERNPDFRGRVRDFAGRAVKIQNNIQERLDGPTARRFNARFTGLSEAQRIGVRARARFLEIEDGRIKLGRANDTLLTAALRARSTVERDAALAEMRDNIERSRRAGLLTPAAAERARAQAFGRFDALSAEALVETSPGRALAELRDASKFKNLDPGVRQRLIIRATKRLRALAKAAVAAVNKDVTALREGFTDKGLELPKPVLDELTARAKATGNRALQAGVALMADDNEFAVEFGAKPLVDQNRQITDLINKTAPGATSVATARFAARRLAIAQRVNARTRRLATLAPNAGAVRQGVTRPNPVIPSGTTQIEDHNNPGALVTIDSVESIRRRVAAAPFAAEHFGLPRTVYFDSPDAGRFAAFFRAANLDGKMKLAETIVRGAGARAPDVFAEIAPKDGTLATVGMLAFANRRSVGREVLVGTAQIAENASNFKFLGKLRSAAFGVVLPLLPPLDGLPSDVTGAASSRLADAITSVYVSRTVGAGKTAEEEVDDNRLAGAVKDVTGGIIEVNGAAILAPRADMSTGDAQRLWRGVTQDILEASTGARPTALFGSRQRPVTDERLQRMRLRSVGMGRYEILAETTEDTFSPLRDPRNGRAYRFDWSDIEAGLKAALARARARPTGGRFLPVGPGAPVASPSPAGTRPGAIVGTTREGRPIIVNPEGGLSTEQTTTVEDPRQAGRFINIPTLFGGKKVGQAEALAIITGAGFKDPDTGRRIDSFASIAAAETAARKRSKALDEDPNIRAAFEKLRKGNR